MHGQKYTTLESFTKEVNPAPTVEKLDSSGEEEEMEKAEQSGENTADFDDIKARLMTTLQSDEHESNQMTIDSDKPVIPYNVNGSGFFSRDFRVLQNATYGTVPDHGLMLLKQLKEQEEEKNAEEEAAVKE